MLLALSDIREAMVKIMIASSTQEESGIRCIYDKNDELVARGDGWLLMDPATCILWSAVGFGALLSLGRSWATRVFCSEPCS